MDYDVKNDTIYLKKERNLNKLPCVFSSAVVRLSIPLTRVCNVCNVCKASFASEAVSFFVLMPAIKNLFVKILFLKSL